MAEISWFHNVAIVEQVKNPVARVWVAKATKEFGWSRAVLGHQIIADAFGRKGKATRAARQGLKLSDAKAKVTLPASPGYGTRSH